MPESGTVSAKKKRTNIDFYHSPTQLRFDTWHRLEEHTNRLREKHMRKADVAALTRRIDEDLTLLDTMEFYTAFPSRDDIRFLRQLFEQQDFGLLSRVVGRIVRALTGGTYRSRQINLRVPAEAEEREEAMQHREDERQHQRPYFEVLFVDEGGPEDVKRLREALHGLRRRLTSSGPPSSTNSTSKEGR